MSTEQAGKSAGTHVDKVESKQEIGTLAGGQVTGIQIVGDITAGDITIIQQIIQQRAEKQLIAAPYKFLDSYDISDKDIFFGRDVVIEELVGKMPRYKTLVINGRSGSGKTSLINAGLIPRLAENGYQYLSFRDYSDPLRQLREHVAQNDLFKAYADQTTSFTQFLKTVTRQQNMHLVVIFDQFERFFINVLPIVRTQFIQEMKACLESDLSGAELDLVFALREEFFGQLTREFVAYIPTFLKETDLFNLEPLSRKEARDAIIKPLQRLTTIKIGYDDTFVDEVLLPGLMGESTGGMAIDPPHLQIVCNQLYEQAKERNAAKLERGGVVEINRALYDELHGTTGILQNYLEDRLAKITPQMADGQAVLRSMLKTMITATGATGTRKFVTLGEVQRELADVPPEIVAEGLRALNEERIIETRGQGDAVSYSLSHEVMVPKVQSWFDEREMERKKAQETLERGVAEWKNSKEALLTEKQVERIRKWLGSEGLNAEAGQLLQTSQVAYEQAAREKAEREQKLREEEEARREAEKEYAEEQHQRAIDAEQHAVALAEQRNAALKIQSLFLADLARQENEKQNHSVAMLLALEALPKDISARDKRPYVPEAELQLYTATTHVWVHNKILTGHTGSVNSVTFSPDGMRLVTVSEDNTVRVWDVATSTVLATLIDHAGEVSSLAFNPNGTQIVTRLDDQTARVWDATTGTALVTLTGHTDRVTSAAFSPDGTRIVTASVDDTARVWDATTGTTLVTLTGHEGEVSSAAFSPDGTRIVTASCNSILVSDDTVRVWDAATGTELVTLTDYSSKVSSTAFSPNGTRLVMRSRSDDQMARVWDAVSGTELATLTGHTEPVTSAAFSPDGMRIVTASEDGTARVWDVSTALGTGAVIVKEVATLIGHTDRVTSAAFSPDGMRIVTASADNTVRMWDAVSDIAGATLTGHTGLMRSAAFSPDGTRVVTASEDRTARVWDAATGTTVATLTGHTEPVTSAVFSPDGTRIVTASVDDTARVWEAATGQEVATLTGHTSQVNLAAFSPDGMRIVTASCDQTARVWEAATGKELATLTGHTDAVWSAAFSPDGTRIVTASGDGTARVWDVATGNTVATLTGHCSVVISAAFSPDGTRIVTASSDETARVWDVATGNTVATLTEHTLRVLSAAFSPDGTRIVTASDDTTARVWDAATGAAGATLTGHYSVVTSAAFSPDGTRIVTASYDNTARVWDAMTGMAVATLICHDGGVLSAAFSPDGTRIVTASDDQTVRVWRVFRTTQELIDYANRIVPRRFTPEERKKYFLE